jgi:hypothetical protein
MLAVRIKRPILVRTLLRELTSSLFLFLNGSDRFASKAKKYFPFYKLFRVDRGVLCGRFNLPEKAGRLLKK